MNIGITLGLQQDNESLWINGIKLNVLNLIETLSEIGDHSVYALDTSNKVKDLSKVDWDTSKYPIYKYADKVNSTDLLILLGTSFSTEQTVAVRKKNPKIKIIKYFCGNNYIIDMERVLFDSKESVSNWTHGHDEAWFIPQQEYQNRSYYQTMGRLSADKVKVVPFVWSPKFIKEENSKNVRNGMKDAFYKGGKNAEDMNLSSMEPNMNVVKYCMPLIMMVEELYRKKGKKAFNEFWVGSGKRLLSSKYFISSIKHLDVTHSGKLKMCSMYPVTNFLSEKTDIVLSHQWDNPLNYAYLDALYFGYPLVHNATMIKDAGYYYKGFDTVSAAKMLENVLNHHDEIEKEYTAKSTKVLSRYLTTNPNIVDTYKKLIENIFEPGKHALSNEYDWSTNLYK